MIFDFKTSGCKRCNSANSEVQILIPDKDIKRGVHGEYSAEIVCNECGKINRTKMKVKIE